MSLEKIRQQIEKADTILGFCEHGKAVGMVIDLPAMKQDVRDFMASHFYRRFERVSASDGRTRFDGNCAECSRKRGTS